MATPARDFQSIGEVLVKLKPEFPDITISKIRFLESEGLVAPQRTASGYRKFYDRDVQRLRAILRLQRDEYLPLRVIRERLDGAAEPSPITAAVRPEPSEDEEERDEVPQPGAVRMTAGQLAAATGVEVEVVDALQSFGLLRPSGKDGDRMFDGDDLVILRIAKDFFKYGLEPRHLTMYRHFSDREATIFEQIVTPMLRQRNPEARRMATNSLGELARIARRLKFALLRANLRRWMGD